MEFQVRHSPAFAVVRSIMQPGEAVVAESGAMMAMSTSVVVESKMQGGLKKGLMRSVLGGESLFLSTFTAGGEGGWVDCAANLPGDAFVLDVDGAYNLTRGAFLFCEQGIELDTKWGGFKNLAGGEGGFLIHCSGRGQVVAAAYGATERWPLAAGQSLVVDSGHLVAFTPETQFTTRRVSTGFMNTLKSGEGLVFEFVGPGEIHVQSRNPHEFIGWLTNELPFQRG